VSDLEVKGTRECAGCSADISWRHGRARWCLQCQGTRLRSAGAKPVALPLRIPGANRAHQAIYRAVKSGRLPRPDTLICADCGARATSYDHRDYNKPMEVDPVCKPCNLKRGHAIPMVTSTQTEVEWLKDRLSKIEKIAVLEAAA
jgi:hypothetical protein